MHFRGAQSFANHLGLSLYSELFSSLFPQKEYTKCMGTHKGKAAVSPCSLAFLGNNPVCSVSE